MVKNILRIEGLVTFLISIYFFDIDKGNLIYFFAFLITPDISMVGYLLSDKKIGAIIYNLVHNYILAIILIGFGMVNANGIIWQAGWVLLGHIGLDRFFGFGLKYPSSFKDTHIQKL